MRPPLRCRGPAPINRRRVLQAGGIGLLGLSLPRLLRAEAQARRASGSAGPRPSADACILVFLNGGPSHLDMWDMKPDAPAEIRGEFRPIASSLPTVRVCEHLPRFARVIQHGTLIRAAHHRVNIAHGAAVYCSLTGLERGQAGGGPKPTDHPAIGSVVGLCRPPDAAIMPYVSMPHITTEGPGGPPQPGLFGGWLGRTHDPLFILDDPDAPDFSLPELTLPAEVSPARLAGRKALLGSLGATPPHLALDRRLQDMDRFEAKAFELLTSPAARRAFRLDREDPRTRERYGRNIYGQSVLLARRLIEAGTRVACISWAPDATATWDTDRDNFAKLKDTLLPQFDAALSSLIEDLIARGRFDRTLVVAMGEFGRSPRVNAAAGRDHWNHGYSLWLAGGGIKRGHIHGSTDKIGALPRSDPVTPAEIVATIYRCMGVAPDLELHDPLGRPLMAVPHGQAIDAILE